MIKQPSVSAKNDGLHDCANLVLQLMNNSGINSKLLYLDTNREQDKENKVKIFDNSKISTNGSLRKHSDSNTSSFSHIISLLISQHQQLPPPIVYGEVKSKSRPNGKTILFYNHYDVQPEDPKELWKSDPFSGKIENGYIYGRGASDDKGELITRIKAVEYCLKNNNGDLPCNVKFIVEGEEEIGSPHLKDYLIQYKDNLNCDLVIWESGFVDSKGRAIISLGQKGILCVEINVNGPSRDIHSSHAVLIENPSLILSKIICSLVDDKTGRILIKDWYKEVKDFSSKEISLIVKEEFDEEGFKKETGIESFINNMTGIDAKIARVGNPTCNISGLISGYGGFGSKTIIPSLATAKIDFRLVPNMDHNIQFQRLKTHIKENMNFDESIKDKIEIKFLNGEPGYRTPIDNPFVTPVTKAAQETFNGSIISVSAAGTGPMYYFHEILNAPSICVGGSDITNNAHSPNECFKIDSLIRTTKCILKIIEKIGTI